MNTLSWLLYAAEALERLQWIVGFSAFVGFALTAVLQAVALSVDDGPVVLPHIKRIIATIAALALLSCLIPSKQTVYMIAASELAERVVVSPEGRELTELLKRRVREALGDGSRP